MQQETAIVSYRPHVFVPCSHVDSKLGKNSLLEDSALPERGSVRLWGESLPSGPHFCPLLTHTGSSLPPLSSIQNHGLSFLLGPRLRPPELHTRPPCTGSGLPLMQRTGSVLGSRVTFCAASPSCQRRFFCLACLHNHLYFPEQGQQKALLPPCSFLLKIPGVDCSGLPPCFLFCLPPSLAYGDARYTPTSIHIISPCILWIGSCVCQEWDEREPDHRSLAWGWFHYSSITVFPSCPLLPPAPTSQGPQPQTIGTVPVKRGWFRSLPSGFCLRQLGCDLRGWLQVAGGRNLEEKCPGRSRLGFQVKQGRKKT